MVSKHALCGVTRHISIDSATGAELLRLVALSAFRRMTSNEHAAFEGLPDGSLIGESLLERGKEGEQPPNLSWEPAVIMFVTDREVMFMSVDPNSDTRTIQFGNTERVMALETQRMVEKLTPVQMVCAQEEREEPTHQTVFYPTVEQWLGVQRIIPEGVRKVIPAELDAYPVVWRSPQGGT